MRRLGPVALRVGLAVALGAGALVITRSARAGDDPPDVPEIEAIDGVTAELLPALDLDVAEVAVPIVAPLPQGDDTTLYVDELPLVDPEQRASAEAAGAIFQTDITEVVSPIVGEMMVPVAAPADGDTGAADPTTLPPPALAAALGLPAADVTEDVTADVTEDVTEDVRSESAEEDATVAVSVDLDTLPDLIGALGSGGGGGSGSGGPTFSESSARDGGAEEAGELSEPLPGRGASPVGAPPEPVGGLGFADPCAAIERDSGDFCPEDGEPGTVTESFALTTPPTFSVDYFPRDFRCAREVDSDEIFLAVTSTTPIADLELVVSLVDGRQRQIIPLATPEDTTREWLREFEAATTDPPSRILHCTTVPNLQRGFGHVVRARGTDVFDQEAWFGWAVRFNGPDFLRPRTLVLPVNASEVMVSAARRPDQEVRIRAYRRNGDPMEAPIDPCAGLDDRVQGFDRPTRPERMVTDELNSYQLRNQRSILARAGFDPDYSHRSFGALRLVEGSSYRLCVYRSVTSPSFEAGIESVEAFDVATPDAYEVSFSVLDVEPDNGVTIPAGAIEVEVRALRRSVLTPSGWCGRWRSESDHSERERVRAGICTVPSDQADVYTGGARVTLRARNAEGEEFSRTVVVHLPSCDDGCPDRRTDRYRLELPDGGPPPPPLCGAFGLPCRAGTYGTIVLSVSYDNDRGSGRSTWSVSEPSELGDQRPTAPAPTPRLDTTQRTTVSGPGLAQTLTMPIIADRPVTVRARVVNGFGEAPCVAAGSPPSATSDTFSETHELVLTGFCPSQSLLPIVELTDESGAISRWHAAPGVGTEEPVEAWHAGLVWTMPVRWNATGTVTLDLETTRFGLRRFDVRVNDRTADWTYGAGYSFGVSDGCLVNRGAPIRATMPSHFSRSDLTVTVDIEIQLEVTRRLCGDGPPDGPDVEPFVVHAEIPARDIVVGEPIRFDAALPIPGPDGLPSDRPDALVSVAIVFTSSA